MSDYDTALLVAVVAMAALGAALALSALDGIRDRLGRIAEAIEYRNSLDTEEVRQARLRSQHGR